MKDTPDHALLFEGDIVEVVGEIEELEVIQGKIGKKTV